MDKLQVFILQQENLFSPWSIPGIYTMQQNKVSNKQVFFCFANLFLLLAWLPSGKNVEDKTGV